MRRFLVLPVVPLLAACTAEEVREALDTASDVASAAGGVIETQGEELVRVVGETVPQIASGNWLAVIPLTVAVGGFLGAIGYRFFQLRRARQAK